MSVLVAQIVVMNVDGTVISCVRVDDFYPDVQSGLEVTEVQPATQSAQQQTFKNNMLLPSQLSKNGLAVIHSVVSSLDVTATDCIFCLPRQTAVGLLDLESGKVSELYSQVARDKSSTSGVLQQLIGRTVCPLSVSRVSHKLYLLGNNESQNQIQVWTLFLPNFIQHGAKDFGDVLDTEIKSDYPEEETQPTSQTVDDTEQDCDNFKLLEQTVIMHN